MEKTHKLTIDFIRVEDPSWNVVTKWTQKKVFNSMVNFLMEGFKIPKSQKTEDNHQVIAIVGDEKLVNDSYEKIVNVESKKLKDISYTLRKVMPKSVRNKLATVEFSEDRKIWTKFTTMLGLMGILLTIIVDKYLNTKDKETV